MTSERLTQASFLPFHADHANSLVRPERPDPQVTRHPLPQNPFPAATVRPPLRRRAALLPPPRGAVLPHRRYRLTPCRWILCAAPCTVGAIGLRLPPNGVHTKGSIVTIDPQAVRKSTGNGDGVVTHRQSDDVGGVARNAAAGGRLAAVITRQAMEFVSSRAAAPALLCVRGGPARSLLSDTGHRLAPAMQPSRARSSSNSHEPGQMRDNCRPKEYRS